MTFFRPVMIAALACALTGCGHSKPAPDLSPKGGYPKTSSDWRTPVAHITALEVAPTTTGAIVTARGLPPTQGYWGTALIPENDGQPVDGVITYRFVLAKPPVGSPDSQRAGNPPSREVTAGAFINAIRFAQTKQVVVIGADGSRTAHR